jgi:hypothetical protein
MMLVYINAIALSSIISKIGIKSYKQLFDNAFKAAEMAEIIFCGEG